MNSKTLLKNLKQRFPDAKYNFYIYFVDFMGQYPIPKTRDVATLNRLDSFMTDDEMQLILNKLYAGPNNPKQTYFVVDNGGQDIGETPTIDEHGIPDISQWYIYLGPEGWTDKSAKELYDLLMEFEGGCEHAFSNAGGDDDTFDYVPNFIWLYENLLDELGMKDEVKRFRHGLYELDPEYPEFFTDEEETEWAS